MKKLDVNRVADGIPFNERDMPTVWRHAKGKAMPRKLTKSAFPKGRRKAKPRKKYCRLQNRGISCYDNNLTGNHPKKCPYYSDNSMNGNTTRIFTGEAEQNYSCHYWEMANKKHWMTAHDQYIRDYNDWLDKGAPKPRQLALDIFED